MLDFRMDTFLTVCRHMSYTKAARALHITQPAVSQHIHYIEKEYGVKLFGFEGKKMTLTPEGTTLLHAISTMKHDDMFLREHLQSQRQKKHSLFFGVTLTIGEYVVSDVIAKYLADYPNTRIQISVANTQELLQKLDADEIDFALVEGYFPKSDYDSMVYSRERFIAVGNNTNFPAMELPDLFSHTLLVREPGSGSREILENYLHLHNYSITDFQQLIEVNNIRALKGLAQNSCGITFLYEIAARQELEEHSLQEIEIKDFHITHEFTFIWKKGSIFSNHYRSLFEHFG